MNGRCATVRGGAALAAAAMLAAVGCAPSAVRHAVAEERPEAGASVDPPAVASAEAADPSAEAATISARGLPPPPAPPDPLETPPLVPLSRTGDFFDDEKTHIDAELARLSRVLGGLRAAAHSGEERTPPPRAGIDAWERILEHLDRYLDQPPRATPPVQLVRARITVESELEADQAAWQMSGALASRIRSRLAYMAHRIEIARGDLLPIPEGSERLSFEWPVDPVVVTSDFGWRADPFHGRRRFHRGLDLEADQGQPVFSAGEGIITWAGWNGGHGNQIEIAHPGGWTTRYSHLSLIAVRDGDRVRRGNPIGLAGSTGRATGPHLHFEVWHDGDVRDPIEVLGEPPIYFDGVAARGAPARGGD